jgi:hypothetical protein
LPTSVEDFKFAALSVLRRREANSYNRSEKNLHHFVFLCCVAGDPATFRRSAWRNASGRALLDVALSGGTSVSRSPLR